MCFRYVYVFMYLYVYVFNPTLEPNRFLVEWDLTSLTQTSEESFRQLHYAATKYPSILLDCAWLWNTLLFDDEMY